MSFAILALFAMFHAPTPPQKPEIRIASLETQVFDRINDERAKAKLPQLLWDSKLAEIARDHSKDMAKHNFFDHVNGEGENPTERGAKAGFKCEVRSGAYIYEGIAENIFQNNLYDRMMTTGTRTVYDWNSEEKIVRTSVRGWMESPGHRANILNSKYRRTGIGVAISPDMKVLITQDFC